MVFTPKGKGEMKASIGLITWNAKRMLADCLDSILHKQWRYAYEIVIVDNGSQDGTIQMLRQEYIGQSQFPIKLITNKKNQGVTKARNQIIKAARGEFILMLDVDTLVLPGALDVLVETMAAYPKAAVVGPKLVYRNGQLQLSCRRFPSPLNIVIEGTVLRNWFPHSHFVKEYTMEDWDHATVGEVDWVYGAAMLIRRQYLYDIGLFDEKFFYLYEDIDFCFRAKKKGYTVIYVPQAVIVHFLDREKKGMFHPLLKEHIKSIFRYLVKDYYGLL